MPEHAYTVAELDAALDALTEPGRLERAEGLIAHSAPTLQRVLLQALNDGGWFGQAHEAQVSSAAGEEELQERVRAVSTLVAEQTRLGMFVGVAVGFELANELTRSRGRQPSAIDRDPAPEED